MNRTIPLMIGAMLVGALGAYGVSVARGASGEGALSVRATANQGNGRLYQLLQKKDNALKRREDLLENEKQDLRTAEAALQSRLLELQKLRDQIREMLTDLDGEREQRVANLVKMFESMRPKQAAAILEVTEDEIALEVLERMNQGKAGKTLAAMNPERAAGLAERIGRAALTPPEEG
jgi:flagellar motility protein MotE (MotC chaperone)